MALSAPFSVRIPMPSSAFLAEMEKHVTRFQYEVDLSVDVNILEQLTTLFKLADNLGYPFEILESDMFARTLLARTKRVDSLAVPHSLRIGFKGRAIEVTPQYIFGQPLEIIETIPMIGAETKINVYQELGFAVIPPSSATFAACGNNSAYLAVKAGDCKLLGGGSERALNTAEFRRVLKARDDSQSAQSERFQAILNKQKREFDKQVNFAQRVNTGIKMGTESFKQALGRTKREDFITLDEIP